MDQRNCRLVALICLVLAAGLITAPDGESNRRYGLQESPETTEAANATPLTALPSAEQQTAKRLIEGDTIEVRTYRLHPLGLSFDISRSEGQWYFDHPPASQLSQHQPISHDDQVYVLVVGTNYPQLNPLPFLISGGGLLVAGWWIFVRTLN